MALTFKVLRVIAVHTYNGLVLNRSALLGLLADHSHEVEIGFCVFIYQPHAHKIGSLPKHSHLGIAQQLLWDPRYGVHCLGRPKV